MHWCFQPCWTCPRNHRFQCLFPLVNNKEETCHRHLFDLNYTEHNSRLRLLTYSNEHVDNLLSRWHYLFVSCWNCSRWCESSRRCPEYWSHIHHKRCSTNTFPYIPYSYPSQDPEIHQLQICPLILQRCQYNLEGTIGIIFQTVNHLWDVFIHNWSYGKSCSILGLTRRWTFNALQDSYIEKWYEYIMET